jgi:hypothetical protein
MMSVVTSTGETLDGLESSNRTGGFGGVCSQGLIVSTTPCFPGGSPDTLQLRLL